MPIDFKVELTICDEFVTQFLELVEIDKARIYSNNKNSAIKSLRVIKEKNKNNFILLHDIKKTL